MISNAIDPYILLARALALIIVIPVHEASHALVAYWLGDSTARNMGRLSLNPIRHFDLMGSISLLIIGIIGCHAGMKVGNDAESLGAQTSSAVVNAIFAVILADALFSIFFSEIGI